MSVRNEKGHFIKGHDNITKKGKRPNFHGNSGSFKKGVSASPETQFKKGMIPKNKGIKGKHPAWNKGMKIPYKERPRLKGKKPWNKGMIGVQKGYWTGKKRPEISGKNHFNWQGGVSEYAPDWNQTLKRSIRERDNYTCQMCGELQSDIAFHVHHIDYEKSNCDPDNLITLCISCHTKTNFNRKYWLDYFNKLNK